MVSEGQRCFAVSKQKSGVDEGSKEIGMRLCMLIWSEGKVL